MKKIYTLLFAFVGFCLIANAQSQMGEIRGKIADAKTKKPLDYVSVTIELNGVVKAQVLTDDDGNFIAKTLQPGTYTIKVTNLGYRNTVVSGIRVASDQITFENVAMDKDDGQKLPDVIIRSRPPLIRPDGASVKTLTSDAVMALGTRNVNGIANLAAGVDSRAGNVPTFRGARADGTAYYIDGVRIQGGSSTNIPQNAIDQLQVITGGTPAQYGDFIGGAISITTKSPTKNWTRSFEYQTSSPFTKYLDNSQYNELQVGVSGPIKVENKGKEDKERVILGFSLYGSGVYARDGRMSVTDMYKVKDSKLREMEENPLVPQQGGGFIPAGEYLTKADLEKVDYRQNMATHRFNLQGNFNYQPTTNVNVRLGYQAEYSNDKSYSYANSLANYDNNANILNYTIRPYIQFTQTFGKKAEGADAKKSVISNAFYTVRFSYERRFREVYDPNHGDRIFDYGFVGTFDKYQRPAYQRVTVGFRDSAVVYRLADGTNIRLINSFYKEAGVVDTALIYKQADINRIKGNYTRSIYDYYTLTGRTVSSISELRGLQGIANGDEPNGVYSNLWSSPGRSQTGYQKFMNEAYTLYVMSEASVAPSRNPKSKHDLQFGFTYEQQFQRSYFVNSVGLWGLMRQLVNNQFSGYNEDSTGRAVYNAYGVFQDTIRFDRRIIASDQKNFDRNLRDKLIAAGATDPNGNPITQNSLLNTDAYDPSMYSLDMFSADELLNDGNSYVSYYGYSHKGDRVSGKPSIEKFLNDPANRTLGAYQPVYMAAWFQDKFVFKDLIVRLGVRMERFDANQLVLKDPYSLAPTYTAGDVRRGNLVLNASNIPSNIGDDYTVYVNNEDPNSPGLQVSGFRKGNDWYDKSGNPVSDPTALYKQSALEGAPINRNTPYLVNTAQKEPTAASFKDYVPDVKFLPRIWFSFPISTTSQFFGTYDVLAQRPTQANIGQIDDYFYMRNRLSSNIANPDLKMTQVTDYQIGFRQQIGTDASLGIIASYREYRNLIQQYRYVQAWPYDYTTYGNIDFSTVKSIQLEYELRELGNINISANYMLQFANGTGSNADQTASLIQAGTPNQRTIFPLDYDVRHTLKGTFDFHYKGDKEYDGPVVAGKKIFANAGFNLIFNLSSGRPYTQTTNPVPEVQSGVVARAQVKGTINGSNLPSQFYSDLNVDKNFFIRGEVPGGKTTIYRLRIFLSVQNLFDNINVLSVFRYTGSAYDDGFITSTYAESQLRSATNAQSLVDLYNVRAVDPGRFALPRLTRLGVALYF
ncbi:MAG: carboxypeptidase regulatory-like domain-containing protein [Bacteroidota bacterium]